MAADSTKPYSSIVLDLGEYGLKNKNAAVLVIDDPSPHSSSNVVYTFQQPSVQQTDEQEYGQPFPVSVQCTPAEYGVAQSQEITVFFQPAEFGLTKYDLHGEELYCNGLGTAVRLVHNRKTGEKVALKVMEKSSFFSPEDRSRAQREIAIHQSLNHPNIVRLYDTFEDNDRLYMAIEYVPGGSLYDKMKYNATVPEPTARNIARELISALDYLHDRNIVHCDVKPENILLDHNKNVKLCDFGLARPVKDGLVETKDVLGSIGYMAPEVMKRRPFDFTIDMWAVGIILYQLLVGFEPFYPSHAVEPQVPFPQRYFKNVSKEACDLIQQLLQLNPSERYSAKQALAHPWLAAQPATAA